MSSPGLGGTGPLPSASAEPPSLSVGHGSRHPGLALSGAGRAAAPQHVCLRATPACPPGDPRAQAFHGGDKRPRQPERLPWERRAGTPRATAAPSTRGDTGPQGSGARRRSHSPETPSSRRGSPPGCMQQFITALSRHPHVLRVRGPPPRVGHPSRSLQRRGVCILYRLGGAPLPRGSGTGRKGKVGRRVILETNRLLGVIW